MPSIYTIRYLVDIPGEQLFAMDRTPCTKGEYHTHRGDGTRSTKHAHIAWATMTLDRAERALAYCGGSEVAEIVEWVRREKE